MKSSNFKSIDERKSRWCDFLSMKSDTKYVFLINFDNENSDMPKPWPNNKDERIEWIWKSYNIKMERLNWLFDDSIPCLHVHTGTEIFAEAFGCDIYRPKDNMPFALPLIHSALEVSKLKIPKLESTPLMLLFDMADELKRRAGSGAIFKIPDIQSPMDIAALIWDKNDFYTALINEPEAVKELSSKVKQLLMAFLDEWFSRYGKEFIAHYPNYYMPEGITLSEDEVGAVSGKMFDDFFLKELSEMSERYGGIGMHCCANSKHQWSNFKKIPNLKLLNLVQPEKTLTLAYEFFASHVPQMHSWCGNGPSWTWPSKYPSDAHVVIQATAKTKDEAIELCEKLSEALGTVQDSPAGALGTVQDF